VQKRYTDSWSFKQKNRLQVEKSEVSDTIDTNTKRQFTSKLRVFSQFEWF